MFVYFSNLEEISFQNNNSGGIDYRKLRGQTDISNLKVN